MPFGLRNPVDVLHSYHSNRFYRGNEDIGEFGAALAAEDERKKGFRLPKNAGNLKGLLYRDLVKFSEQIQRYLNVFGRKNVHIILYEDLVSEPLRVYQQTLAFLGIEESFVPELGIMNTNKQPRSRMLQSIFSNPFGRLRSFARAIVPASSRNKLKRYITTLNRKVIPRPPMDPDIRRQLIAEFEPELRALRELLGRDLSHWST